MYQWLAHRECKNANAYNKKYDNITILTINCHDSKLP